MLKVMRDSFHQLKWVLIVVVAAFIFGFVFLDMGMGGAFGGDQQQARNYAARVNGETIGFDDYNRALKNVEDMYRQQFGGQFTPEMAQQLNLPTQVVNMLVDQRLLTQEAARLNMTASPEEVRKKLLAIPNFTENGKFIGMELYNNYVGRLGYANPSEFEEDLGREIALQKMESALQNSVVLSPKAIDAEYRRTNENAKVRYVLLPSAPLETVTVSQADINAYYKAHQSDYTHGEQRKIRYILADYQKIRSEITPSEAELRRAYETSKNDFKRPASAKVLHILIKSDQTAPPQADAAARAKAQSIVAQLRGGADFATLARQSSEDPSSSGNGGDMGWVDMGMTVEPFERAIFSIPLNTISDPIKTTEYGYHIVKVTERRNESVQTFEDARPALAARLANDMSRDIAKAEINRVNAQIKQKKPANAAEFVALATGRLTSNDSGWFGRSEAIGGLGNNAPLSQWVFAAKAGDVSDPIGTPRGIAIAFVEMERGAGVAALADVRERVEQDAKRQKAREAARAQLATLMAGAPNLEAIAAKGTRPPQEVTVTHQGAIAGLSGDTGAFVDAALKGAVGQLQGPVAVGDGAVAFQVVEQKKVTDAELAQNRASFANRMREQQARQLRSVLVERLRKTAEVEINDIITRPTTTPTPTAGL
ncbi:MAG TPA: SurA N-terminal domain-containing protein [Thermoanaerobaculia bacterium]|nr:SurA N-terminal domain-containing protein [Thermoanaerobaculia bacterium]